MANNVADITIGSTLIDDYLYLCEAPVAAQLAGRFLVVDNPDNQKELASELLTIAPDGSLLHFRPDPTSQSGWDTNTTTVTPPADATAGSVISRLLGFYENGLLNALAWYPSSDGRGEQATWLQWDPSTGSWSTPAVDATTWDTIGWAYQSEVYTDANGKHYLYGISVEQGGLFFLAAWNATAGQWQMVYAMPVGDFDGSPQTSAAFSINPSVRGNDLTILWLYNTSFSGQDANLVTENGTLTLQWVEGTSFSADPGIGTLSDSRTAVLPADFGGDNLLLTSNDGRLFLVQDYVAGENGMLIPLTGMANQPPSCTLVCAGADQSGTLTIFLADDTSTLWYMQLGAPSGVPPGDWVSLGQVLTTLACPVSMIYGPEIFLVDTNETVYHIARTVTDQVWVERQVVAPAPADSSDDEPTNISGYSMELTAVDATGAPVAGAVLSLTADHACTVIYENLSHAAGSGSPVTIQTDGSGQATVRYQTTDLKPPVFTVTATNEDQSTASRWAQGDVVEVKGTETDTATLDTSVSTQLQTADATTLQDNDLIDPSYSSPSDAAKAINNAGEWTDANTTSEDGTIDATRLTVPHWTIDFTAEGGPAYRALTIEEAQALSRRSAELGSSGGIFGDAAHYFKHLWKELEQFSATVENDVLTIYLNSEKYVISTVKEAGAALETMFNRIMQGLKELAQVLADVLAWLKMMFDWNDVLDTHNVLKAAVKSTLGNIAGSQQAALNDLEEGFDTAKSNITAAFDQLEAFGEQTFNQFVDAIGTGSALGASDDVLAGTQQQSEFHIHSPRCNHIWRLARNAFGSGGVSAATPAALGDSSGVSWQSIEDAFTGAIDTSTVNDLYNSQLAPYFEDPSTFFDQGIADFLQNGTQGLVDYVIGTFESVAEAGLSQSAAAMQALEQALEEKLNIPVVSWLYKYVITGTLTSPGDDLTYLDLICLIQAVPVTILYKLEYGEKPFDSSDAQVIADNGMPWPTAAGAMQASAPGSTEHTIDQVMQVMEICSVFIQLMDSIADTAGDMIDSESDPADNPTITFLSKFHCLTEILLFGISAPYDLFTGTNLSMADKATISNWSWGAIPLAIGTACVVSEDVEVKFKQGYGPAFESCLGVVSEGFGIWTGVEQAVESGYSGYSAAYCIVSPINIMPKLLIEGGEDSQVILGGIDFFVGVGKLVLTSLDWS